jgi:sarcosine oxidase subunit alpha
MSGYRLPAPAGAWIDRSQALRLAFDGRALQGHAGDTLASALLASGAVHVGRSFKLHRPRGVFSCGVEEPTGLVDVGDGARRTPNTRATDIALAEGLVARPGNAWPSLRWDLGSLNSQFAALLPAGFYYKTFMWPGWRWFEPAIRRAAGLGHAAEAQTGADPDRYDPGTASTTSRPGRHSRAPGTWPAGAAPTPRAATAGCFSPPTLHGLSPTSSWTTPRCPSSPAWRWPASPARPSICASASSTTRPWSTTAARSPSP